MDLNRIDKNLFTKSIDVCNANLSVDDHLVELEFVIHKNQWDYKKFVRLCNTLKDNKFKQTSKHYLQLSMNSNLNSNLRYRISIDKTVKINKTVKNYQNQKCGTIKNIFKDMVKKKT